MGERQILFLRVGMDLGYGGLGPLFRDGSFEYVPIPENPKKASSRSLCFSQIPARSGGSIEQFVPARHRGGLAHYDPEFDTYTYGDPTKYKRGQLLRLTREDLLVFYAGLRPLAQPTGSQLYLIGYFTVEKVHEVTAAPLWPPPCLQHLWANAHFRRNGCDPGLVVVEGASKRSRLLQKAVPLSDQQQQVLPDLYSLLGLTGSVKRAGAGRWIPEANVARVERWLRCLESGEPMTEGVPPEPGATANLSRDVGLFL